MHRDDGKRFIVGADENLTAFLELERAIAADLASVFESFCLMRSTVLMHERNRQFRPAGSSVSCTARLFPIMRSVKYLFTIIIISFPIVDAMARIGETLDQCTACYGK